MKKYLLLILLFFCSTIFAENSFFKERLKKANKKDFVVFEYNKLYSVLSVFDIKDDKIILEEITIPKDKFDKDKTFRTWVEKKSKKTYILDTV